MKTADFRAVLEAFQSSHKSLVEDLAQCAEAVTEIAANQPGIIDEIAKLRDTLTKYEEAYVSHDEKLDQIVTLFQNQVDATRQLVSENSLLRSEVRKRLAASG